MNKAGISDENGIITVHQAEQNSILHLVAAKNRQDIMALVLKNGADINARSAKGSTILHMAAARGDLSDVTFILDKGANVGLIDNDGHQALHLAALQNHIDVMKLLLAKGADVNCRTADGSTLLHLAVANNLIRLVEFLLQRDNLFLTTKDNDMLTPLALAKKLGHDAIAMLLKEKIDGLRVSKLIAEIKEGRLDEVKSLVLKGTDVNGFATDEWGVWAPLHRAAGYHGNLEITKFLVERGADVDIREKTCRRTPLFEAAFWGHIDIIEYLLENGAELNADCDNKTPLKVAIQYRQTRVIEYLKSKGGY